MKIIIESSDEPDKVDDKNPARLLSASIAWVTKIWTKPSTVSEPEFSPGRRLLFVAGVLFLAWGIVAFRLIGLYFGDAELMENRVADQQTTKEFIRARPGDILDREGRLLATSVDMKSLFVVPRNIKDLDKFSQQLAAVLQMEPAKIKAKIDRHRKKNFLWISRRLKLPVVQAIHDLELDQETYGFRREYRRNYPNGSLGIHLLGLRDIDGVGHGGIEQAYQKTLSGKQGQRVLVRDARNHIVHLYEDPLHRVVQGKTIQLTIDIRLQQVLEQELDQVMQTWQPRGCCAILCDPQTGEILGMASRPTFNPEDSSSFRDDAWMNRAVAWDYEPGSTIKPLIVAAALEQNAVSQDTVLHGHWGEYRMGKRLLHDTHSYGELTLAEVLIKSSNIGMAQVGERMTNAGLYQALQRFGFGLRTGSGLPGELTGKVRPLSQWNQYSTGSIPMGQEFSVTPLQMIAAHSVLANGGAYRQPRFVLKFDQKDAQSVEPGLQMRLIQPDISRWIVRQPMRQVMTEGTGRRVNDQNLSLFGKTGTSQVYDSELGGYSRKKTVCSFVCGVPAQNPKLLVLVAVDQPTLGRSHFGGTVAGPAAVNILKKTYPLQENWLAKTAEKHLRR
ncbi:MAG: penicillin-binding protein 2 [Planctomycetaceae bacterium]|nr:penicillin-binding protein 2 [Planctomycetaceae bacterium]